MTLEWPDNAKFDSLLAPEELLEQVQRLGIIADKNDLVISFSANTMQESVACFSVRLPERKQIQAHLSNTMNLPPHSQCTV